MNIYSFHKYNEYVSYDYNLAEDYGIVIINHIESIADTNIVHLQILFLL